MDEQQKQEQQVDEQVEDLDVSKEEAEDVTGGRKAGGKQQEYLVVKLEDVQISSF
jgi:hypothetical protein